MPGRTIVYERVKNYWGAISTSTSGVTISTSCASNIFAISTVAIEAFKADHIDWRTENSAKNWATSYDFPAVKDKRVLLEEFPTRSTGIMQAFVFNTRREKFKDPRVRRAFNFAFDFEEMNKQIFFGQYKRIASYFEGTELASSGLPQGQELAILEAVRDKVPAEVFSAPYTNPVAGAPDKVRGNLREAVRLLKEAGYEVRDHKLVNAQTRRAVDGGIPERRSDLRTGHSCSTSLRSSAWRYRDRAYGRRCPIRESVAQLGFRYDRRFLAAIIVARQ